MERASVDPYGAQKPAERTRKKFQLVEGGAGAVNFLLTLPFHLGMLEKTSIEVTTETEEDKQDVIYFW